MGGGGERLHLKITTILILVYLMTDMHYNYYLISLIFKIIRKLLMSQYIIKYLGNEKLIIIFIPVFIMYLNKINVLIFKIIIRHRIKFHLGQNKNNLKNNNIYIIFTYIIY